MKPLHPSLTGRISSGLRVALAITLLLAGVAIAFIGSQPERKAATNFPAKIRRLNIEEMEAVPGRSKDERGPWEKAEEDYALRAYPATDLPFETPLRSHAFWTEFQTRFERANAISPTNPYLNWRLIGPSIATQPAPLSFSGAEYIASGRVEAFALAPGCTTAFCRLWVAAAGGGIWRTDHALDSEPQWTFVSQSFATNAIGVLVYDATSNTLYAGTGEGSADGASDAEAGLGVYKSTDGGDTWTLLAANVTGLATSSPGSAGGFPNNGTYTGNAFLGRGISSILIDPTNASHLFVSSMRNVRGVSSTGAGTTSNPSTPRPPFGLFESTDGGATFNFIWDGGDGCPATCNGTNAKATIRGVNRVRLDPGWNGTTNKIIYGAAMPNSGTGTGVAGSGGIWRSTDGGQTWTQIKSAVNIADTTDRAEFDVTLLPGGTTRMYAGVGNSGNSGANLAHLFRTDDAVAATGDASFTDLTAQQDASGAPNQTTGYCSSSAGGQCWYDNVIYTPPGKPDVVYVGGSYDYDQVSTRNNGRAFLRSTDAGATFTDMTWDAQFGPQSNPPANSLTFSEHTMHPDSHAVVEVPGTNIAIFGSDGGVARNDGTFTDISNTCTDPSRTPGGLQGADLATCQQLLKAVPTQLIYMNRALSTLQFQHLSVSPTDSTNVQGGTQDNGTWQTYNSQSWPQIFFGDGGFSGFGSTNPALRFATTTGNSIFGNFHNGDPTKWFYLFNGISGSALFYSPNIADPSPNAPQTIFHGNTSVWRTQDWGGNQAFLEANCNIFTATSLSGCGDFVPIGPAGATNITSSNAGDYRGTSRAGGNVGFLARTKADTGTLWASTTTGRLFVSKNADQTAANVTYTRIDSLDGNSPGRAITSIYIDPQNPNHAYVAYNGYAFNTPSQPGHVYSVVFNPVGPSATFTNIDGSGSGAFPDFPATSVALAPNGDVYASNDFGVLRLPSGSTTWEVSGANLPNVEITHLTVSPDNTKLYAATHGRSAWVADIPNAATAGLTTQASPTTTTVGNSVKDTATLSGLNAPTGTITFQLFDNSLCGGAPLFTSTVNVNGNGSYDSASTPPGTPGAAGTYYWIASYSGDANNNAITTNCGDPNETVTVSAAPTPVPKASPGITTQASPDITVGATISDTATLSAGASPTGNITFQLFGPDDATCGGGAKFVSTVAVNGNGNYTSASFMPTTAGTYRWVATYSGDAANNGVNTACNDAGETVVVSSQPTPTPTPTATPKATPGITTQTSPNTTLGGSISDTATLSGGSSPTGNVTFQLFGPNDSSCGAAAIFTSTVAVNGDGNYSSASFTPTATGTYRWVATYSGDSANVSVSSHCGDATETVTVAGTPTPTPTATATPTASPTATPPAEAQNISTRAAVGAGENQTIGGFIITDAPTRVLIRGLGPSLTQQGVSGVLADPYLELHGSDGSLLVHNNNWRDSQEAEIAETGLPPKFDVEAAIVITLPPGAYTAILSGNGGGTGVGLVEIYDVDSAGAQGKLRNLSTRADVLTGNGVTIAGFILGVDQGNEDVVIRGLGPSLTKRGVANPLADPFLEIRDKDGTLLISDDNWQDDPDQADKIRTAGLAPSDPNESAIATTLPPGNYTAILSGTNNGTGVGLVELYFK